MTHRIVPGLGWIIVAIITALAPASVSAASQKALAEAPVPAEIVSAKRVFISNNGRGCSPFGEPLFSGGPNRSFDQFYAAMRSWNRYKLAISPSTAKLDFQIGLRCPPVTAAKGGAEIHAGTTYDPQLRLTILDLKTHTVLWVITVHVRRAILQSNRDKNFDRAMAVLVTDLKNLTAQPSPTHAAPKAGS